MLTSVAISAAAVAAVVALSQSDWWKRTVTKSSSMKLLHPEWNWNDPAIRAKYGDGSQVPSETPTAAQTDVVIPIPDTQEDRIKQLVNIMAQLKGEKREEFRQAAQGALSPNSPGGSSINNEEQRALITRAIDSSQLPKIMVDTLRGQNPGSRREAR